MVTTIILVRWIWLYFKFEKIKQIVICRDDSRDRPSFVLQNKRGSVLNRMESNILIFRVFRKFQDSPKKFQQVATF